MPPYKVNLQRDLISIRSVVLVLEIYMYNINVNSYDMKNVRDMTVLLLLNKSIENR